MSRTTVLDCHVVACSCAVLRPLRPALAADAKQMEANKKTVLAFYDAGLNKKDFEAASKYLGSKYIQHNPGAADGPEGLKAFLAFLKESSPTTTARSSASSPTATT